MTKQQIELPKKLKPLFLGKARYRVALGGRGSGKSWSVAQMLVARAAQMPIRVLCARELQKSIKDSALKLIADTIVRLNLDDQFDVGETYIRHKNGSDFIFKGLKHNASEIKSTEGVDICWVEEGDRISKESWELLVPTIRAPGSEIWVTYNPANESDEVHQMFVVNDPPPNSRIVKINWDDNPWFPKELDDERLHCLAVRPDDYPHIWGGECKAIREGYIYAKELKRAKDEGRFVSNLYDESNSVRTAWDIGASDATAIWFYQWVGGQIQFIDYYESISEDPRDLVKLIKSKPYIYQKHILPHDSEHKKWTMDGIMSARQMIAKLGIDGRDISVQSVTQSVRDDIYAASMMFNKCIFDKEKCKMGLESLAQYHRKYNEDRNIYSNDPVHDWSSHGCDAFRYAIIDSHSNNSHNRTQRPIDTEVKFSDLLDTNRDTFGSKRI